MDLPPLPPERGFFLPFGEKLMFIVLLAAKPQTFSRGEGGPAKPGRKRNGEI